MFVLDRIKHYAGTGRTALINREESLSFAELEAQSEAFAAWLLDELGGDRSPVVIYGQKETAFLPCIYGALKAGRAYVPVDVIIPPDRAAEIVADVNPRVIVDFSGAGLTCDSVTLDPDSLDRILQNRAHPPVSRKLWVSGDDTAYILFTSGSTGKPKGVPITAGNLTNFYHGLLPYMGEEEGVILNQISYSFDVSCCSIYVGISMGMTLFTVDQAMTEDLKSAFTALGASQLTYWVSTPSFAELCIRSQLFSAELLPSLGSFLFCGEVLTHKLCDGLSGRFPRTKILNTYGPTEATVLVTAAWITDEMRRDSRPIPIGYSLDEVELRLLDDSGHAIEPDEAVGELLIISDNVGPGYYRRPDLTGQRFFQDPQTGKQGYRTGDLCYRRDGLYYYQGRMDNQLKLNGFRIEVEDIENNLTQLDNISRAAVVPVYEEGRVQYLAAFLLLEHEDGLTPIKRTMQIKKQAAAFLPAYMIPRKLIAVESFPLNTNGKIDKKTLANLLQEAGSL